MCRSTWPLGSREAGRTDRVDDPVESRRIRLAAMGWLDARSTEKVTFDWLSTFEYGGRRIPLMDRQRGIRKPAGMAAALSIRTTFTRPDQAPPYNDAIGDDGLQRYMYRGTDPDHPENRALRMAKEQGLDLIWFVGVAPGIYEPIYPVSIVGEERGLHRFALALDPMQQLITPNQPMTDDTRRYVEHITKARLHQRVFRSQVMLAYRGSCAVCSLEHDRLVDAAHIIEDGKPGGEPVVPNGLAMCKIHHAAYDARILGVRPDLTLHLRQDILDKVDGPMLRHGLQEMHDQRLLVVPRSRASRPDEGKLDQRYAEFLSAG